jgi:hypothetical protein
LRKRIALVNPEFEQTEIWYEGIGSLWGLTNSGVAFYSAACGSEELLCYSFSGNTLYLNNLYASCYFAPTAIEDQPAFTEMSIFPNPCQDWFLINTSLSGSFSVSVYNSMGVQLLRIDNWKPGQRLDISTLKSGIYFVLIENSSGSHIMKIVKT